MLTPVHCIALRTVRLSDSKNLLSVWSREGGRLTFAVPAGSSREARRRRAITAPLGTFEGIADLRSDRDIITVRDVMPMPSSPAMTASPLHGITAMFLAEVLDAILRRSAPDELISRYLFDNLAIFAQLPPQAISNFHISFLFGLACCAGIAPDTDNYIPRAIFDLREGRYIASRPPHNDYIEDLEAKTVKVLATTPPARSSLLPFNRESRRRALDITLRYLGIHLALPAQIKSLDILRDF